MDYNRFYPNDGIKRLKDVPIPFRLTLIKLDGSQTEVDVNSHDQELPEAVAYKLHEPEDDLSVMIRIVKNRGLNKHTATNVANDLIKAGFSRQTPAPTQVKLEVDQAMDDANIGPLLRRRVAEWFLDAEKYPEVNAGASLQNCILTTKPKGGGKVVVTPDGHTIKYTTVRSFWRYRMACWSNEDRVEVYVHLGRGRYQREEHTVHFTSESVQIGCQTIPMSAIQHLAKREGWKGA